MNSYSFPTDWLQQMVAEINTPESKLKFEQIRQFEREVLYAGLKDLNTGIDSPLVVHLSPADFLTVIERCESLSVGVIGIEVFSIDVEPPSKMQMVEIEISPEPGYDWGRRLVRQFMDMPDITVSATFAVPNDLLTSNSEGKGEPDQ